MKLASIIRFEILYNPHVLADTTKHETLANFEKWS